MTVKLVGSSSGSVALAAPASTTSGANIEFKLPVADGSANQVLKTDGSGQLSFASNLVLNADGTVTQPSIPLIKTNMGNTYGSAGSLTTSPASAILQSSAEIDRGDNGWTTSGTNAYTYVCPVTGIYAVHGHISLGDISAGTRYIWTMAYTAGGGNLPLASYVEIMDVNVDDYQNYSYYNTWNFTAGTRVGAGMNAVSGSQSGFNFQWGIHLLA
tara:strand:+ start:401 stop:1042 length:642 start_codon:yes stop_codon:yes gene_type:complete